MDQEKSYEELAEACRKLEKEVEEFQSGNSQKNEGTREMVFNVFHATSQLMALSNLNTGKYVDVNAAFLQRLGFAKEEIMGHTSDELHLFADFGEFNKYITLVSRLSRIDDYAVTLRTKNGEEKPFLFSAETLRFDNETYLLSIFSEIWSVKDRKIRESQGSVLEEIFNTVSSYLALFSVSDDNRFFIIDLNSMVEEVEFLNKNDVIGKYVDETPLINRPKLVELLHHVRITGDAHKLAASTLGDDSEGFYMGFRLTSGNIVITWEPGRQQKKKTDILRQAEIFEKFAEMMPNIVYEVDVNGRIRYGNKRGLELFGITGEDLNRGLTIAELFPDYYETMISNLKSLKSPGEIASNEYYITKKDGTRIPILTHSYAVFHDDKIIGYRGTIIDISKHKNDEEQIMREKAFLGHLIDSTPEAIAITDPYGIITMVNQEFTRLFGYNTEEAINRPINDLVVPDDLKQEAGTLDKLSSERQRVELQTIRTDRNRARIHVSLIVTPVMINNEIAAFLAIYRDITIERKNQLVQEILHNISSAALKQMDIKEIYPTIVHELNKIWNTNNFFIALYDKASETITLPFFSDEKDSFKEVPAKKTITGWVIRNNKSVLLRENDLRQLEESGEIDLVGTPCKVWMGAPLKVENNIIGVMCLQDYNNENMFSPDDLSILNIIANQAAIAIQRRSILDNLIIARQKAEEAAQSKQLFMSTMSHEIRTPLNEVIGITNLLLQSNPRDDQMDYIKTLRFSGNHLLTLVNDVLDYNKMESGKIVFEQVQFNLNDFLDEIMRSYSFRSKAKNLEFKIKKTGDLPSDVIGDPIRLNQILSNLLSNALKFTKQGGIMVSVRELEKNNSQSRIEFSVNDTGIGIAPEKHTTIFESFTQATPDTTRQFGGSGLGLAICKKLVELQGGNIALESEPGRGSTFTFSLSFTIADKGRPKLPGESAETYIGLEGKKILVAEDNKINFFVANKFLQSWGVNVTQAEDGQLAIEALEREEFDLVLMDLHMPVMDGIEATKIIRNHENPRIKNIPIVALTAAIMSANQEKLDGLNINDFVLKPFRPHDLFQRLKKHIR
ncbi:MAG: PAS domain S-box protein [Bacteroidales bacterium]|nr:PAS domain S-box protein [Bacteroidales bacterium]